MEICDCGYLFFSNRDWDVCCDPGIQLAYVERLLWRVFALVFTVVPGLGFEIYVIKEQEVPARENCATIIIGPVL